MITDEARAFDLLFTGDIDVLVKGLWLSFTFEILASDLSFPTNELLGDFFREGSLDMAVPGLFLGLAGDRPVVAMCSVRSCFITVIWRSWCGVP